MVGDLDKLWAVITAPELLSAYRVLSPVGAGAFALMGLLGNFRDSAKRVTPSGYLSICGVIASMTFGAWAGAVEDGINRQEQKEQAEQIERTKQLVSTSLDLLQSQGAVLSNQQKAEVQLERANDKFSELHPEMLFTLPESDAFDALHFLQAKDSEHGLNLFELTVYVGEKKKIDRSATYPDASNKSDLYWNANYDEMSIYPNGGSLLNGASTGTFVISIDHSRIINASHLSSWLDLKGKAIYVSCREFGDNPIHICRSALQMTITFSDGNGHSMHAENCIKKQAGPREYSFYCSL